MSREQAVKITGAGSVPAVGDGMLGMSIRVPRAVHTYLQRKANEGERSVGRQYRKALTEWMEADEKRVNPPKIGGILQKKN